MNHQPAARGLPRVDVAAVAELALHGAAQHLPALPRLLLLVPQLQRLQHHRDHPPPGPLQTSTRTDIGRARMTHLQGECSYIRADSVRGGRPTPIPLYEHLPSPSPTSRCRFIVHSTSVECVFSITPLPCAPPPAAAPTPARRRSHRSCIPSCSGAR